MTPKNPILNAIKYDIMHKLVVHPDGTLITTLTEQQKSI